jgi:Uncharacterized conserved protein (DUF2285)
MPLLKEPRVVGVLAAVAFFPTAFALALLKDIPMKKPPLDPAVADVAPTDTMLTVYDELHMITYLRLLDADADGADWREITQIVLHIDPALEPDRAREAFDSHLARAKWMTEHGYRQLLRGGALS